MRAIGVDGIFTDRPDRMEKKNKPIQVANPPARPLMLFDGDCGFCRYWVERWRHVTGDRVDYETSQEAGAEYPEIPPGEFQRAVQFVETDGRVTGGADAVFRALEYAPRKSALLGFLALPVFRPLARIAYRIIASNRTFFSFLTRVFFDRR